MLPPPSRGRSGGGWGTWFCPAPHPHPDPPFKGEGEKPVVSRAVLRSGERKTKEKRKQKPSWERDERAFSADHAAAAVSACAPAALYHRVRLSGLFHGARVRHRQCRLLRGFV